MNTVYDLELAELILNELKMMYNIENSEDIYKYFLCRFVCSEILNYNNIKKELPNLLHDFEYRKKIIDFVLNELDILTYLDYFMYKNIKISKYNNCENSIIYSLIELEDLCIDLFYKDKFFNEINLLLKKIYNSAKRKSTSKKDSINYEYYLIYYSLNALNKEFKIDEIKESNFYKHIEFIQSMPSIKIEDKCCRYIDSVDSEYNDALKIDEDILERYLYKNLNLIEEGLIPIKRQFLIRDGRLDILAKDKNGTYTIIELKVENDTDLIFQCIHYTTQFKIEKNVSKVRFITISPEYTYGILNSLKQIHKDYNVESYVCSIKAKGIKKRKIDSVKLLKIL